MTQRLIKHGSFAGYKEHLRTEDMCERCRIASRVYNSQYTKANRAKGIKYGSYDVIDNLYKPNPPRGIHSRTMRSAPVASASQGDTPTADPDRTGPDVSAQGDAGPSLADRLRDGLFTLRAEKKDNTDNPYVPTDEYPDYISASDPDPEPSGEDWSHASNDEFLVTAEGIKAIKDNLGAYLITAGMTLELIDPYCGTALRDNIDDIVNNWAKVISHYPSAAKMFMAKGGGKIMAWIDAIMATWPVLVAVYEHHLSRSVKLDSLGNPVRVNKNTPSPNGSFATQPDFNYTVD